MPKVPRDISGRDICKLLSKYGYEITRQTGSHIRLSSSLMGYKHSVTVPDHNSVKIGTMNKILNDVVNYLEVQKEELLDDLTE